VTWQRVAVIDVSEDGEFSIEDDVITIKEELLELLELAGRIERRNHRGIFPSDTTGCNAKANAAFAEN
jgi:hypothetical protein